MRGSVSARTSFETEILIIGSAHSMLTCGCVPGSCTSKKWKYTVKVYDEDEGGPTISVGAWLEKNAPMMAKSRYLSVCIWITLLLQDVAFHEMCS